MDFFEPLDNYCERTGIGFFNEPFNLFSNLAFFIAGILIFRALFAKKGRRLKPGSKWLASVVLIVGFGSSLFHSFANTWSMWADVIPIAVFVFSYLWLFLRFTANLNVLTSVISVLSFILLSVGIMKLSDVHISNGGESYFGTWITLFGISCFYAGKAQSRFQIYILMSAIIFAFSIFLRTIDPIVCPSFPLGTHLFWHICNGIVLYLATISYVLDGQEES